MYETHPSLSPALLLPSLVFSLGKLCKNLSSLCQCSDCPCLSLFYPPSTSSPQHSRARQLLLCSTRTLYPRLSNGSPLIFQPCLLLLCLFSLCSTAPLLSFPSLLSALAPPPPPPPHTPPTPLSLLSVSPLPLVSLSHMHTHTHPPLLCPPSPPLLFFSLRCTQIFSAMTPSCIRARHCLLLIFRCLMLQAMQPNSLA